MITWANAPIVGRPSRPWPPIDRGGPSFPASDPSEIKEPDEGIAEEALPGGFLEPSSRAGSLGKLGLYEVDSVIGRGGMGGGPESL